MTEKKIIIKTLVVLLLAGCARVDMSNSKEGGQALMAAKSVQAMDRHDGKKTKKARWPSEWKFADGQVVGSGSLPFDLDKLSVDDKVVVHGYVDQRRVSRVLSFYPNGGAQIHVVRGDEFAFTTCRGEIVALQFLGEKGELLGYLDLGDGLAWLPICPSRKNRIELGSISLGKDGKALPAHNPFENDIDIRLAEKKAMAVASLPFDAQVRGGDMDGNSRLDALERKSFLLALDILIDVGKGEATTSADTQVRELGFCATFAGGVRERFDALQTEMRVGFRRGLFDEMRVLPAVSEEHFGGSTCLGFAKFRCRQAPPWNDYGQFFGDCLPIDGVSRPADGFSGSEIAIVSRQSGQRVIFQLPGDRLAAFARVYADIRPKLCFRDGKSDKLIWKFGEIRFATLAKRVCIRAFSPSAPIEIVWEGKDLGRETIDLAGLLREDCRRIDFSWTDLFGNRVTFVYDLYTGKDE